MAAWADDAPPPARTEPPETIEVVGTAPVLGSGVPRDRVPANVQVIDRTALDERPNRPLNQALAEALSSGSFTDTQGSAFNSTLNLRGYTASPVLGAAQGVAVYQNGQRVNDGFGDVVNWAAIPSFAIDRLEVTPGASPVFGMNALGGVTALRMKDGYGAPGERVTVTGGSFGAISDAAEAAHDFGGFAAYAGVGRLHEHGWRRDSPADVSQGYFDLATRRERLDAGLSLTLAEADFNGNGGSPKQLLSDDYEAIFTQPDRTDEQLFNLAARGGWAFSDETSLHAIAYWRHNRTYTSNGDEAEFAPCAGDPAFLCNEDGEPLTTTDGAPVSSGFDIDGVQNRTHTLTQAFGAAVQVSDHRDLFGAENYFVSGASLDIALSRYTTGAEAGTLNASRGVDEYGFGLGGNELNTALRSRNTMLGAYFSNVHTLAPGLSATLAGRLASTGVKLTDLDGSALDGDHDYTRFNPAIGLTYELLPSLDTYVSYGEASRAPSPAELACADPEEPCRVPNAFTADPPLDQVVARTVEIGARGRTTLPSGASLSWAAAAYASRNDDDILFVASGPIPGSGYFANAGTTRRLGFEIGVEGRWGRAASFARWGFTQATFRDHLWVASPSNPHADANGNIHVSPGDRIPNLPEHSIKAGFSYLVTEKWSAGVDALFASGRPYQGDESNQLGDVPSFSVVNVETSYELRDGLVARLRVENVFDARYYSAGLLGDPSEVLPQYTNPRFLTPGQPRTIEGSVEWRF